MYRKILVAYNGTPESRFALQECMRLASGTPAEVHLLAVVTPPPIWLAGEFVAAAPTVEDEEAERQAMQDVLNAGREMLVGSGLSVTTHLEVGEPVDVIANMANRSDAELVIVGHSRHKPLTMRWWRGSTDAQLIGKLRCSLLVAADPHSTQ